ncbi:gpW family head-tail joining protein [Pseudovibrio denitrificans]|uniref:gpW family head-tail joining protein n=1 Tax=Pseudovibrio denitrificans TaxID=258256 RepID=UPI0039BF1FB4
MTEAEREKTQKRLDEAEDVLHRLNLGESEIRMRDRSGREIEFKPANKKNLQNYINELRVELGMRPRSGRGSRAVTF